MLLARLRERVPSATRRLVTTGAVLLGALLLFGPATYVVVVRAVEVLAGVVGVAPSFDGWLHLVRSLVAASVALAVVTAVAAVRLHGIAALRRGGPVRRLGRHLLLSGTVLAALVVAVDLLVAVGRWSLGTGRTGVLVLSGAVAVALAWAAVRAAVAFSRGFRGV